MPTPYLLKVSKKTGITMSVLERIWNRAQQEVGSEDWGVVMTVFQSMVKSHQKESKVHESQRFSVHDFFKTLKG